MKYIRLNLIVCFTILFMVGCSQSESQPDEYKEEAVEEFIEIEEDWESKDDEEYVIGPILYNGFIGDYAVSASIDFLYRDNVITGSYYYNNYEKDIALNGTIRFEDGWNYYAMYEVNSEGDTTAEWLIEDTYIDEYIQGEWTNRLTGEKLDFKLLSDKSEWYLHPNSHMVFESKTTGDHFFKNHHFLNHQTKGKSGLILPEDENDLYDNILPVGLPIYEYGIDEGYGTELIGHVSSSNIISIAGNKPVEIVDYDFERFMAVSYEGVALTFKELREDSLIMLPSNPHRELCVKIKDLEKFGYHIEGDGYWLKRNNGDVMGYFPAYFKGRDNEYSQKQLKVYESAEEGSKVILKIDDDEDGFFKVLDVVKVNNEIMAQVRFEYHTQVPCSSEVREAKPSVTGWIHLYRGWPQQLTLGNYSKGC